VACKSYVFPYINTSHFVNFHVSWIWGRGDRDRMVVGFTTTYSISAYHHYRCEFETRSWRRGVLDTTLCDKVCQWLVAGRWFSLSTPVSSTNKTDRHELNKTLLKVSLNTINLNVLYICTWCLCIQIQIQILY
jgi:hypothetical protein